VAIQGAAARNALGGAFPRYHQVGAREEFDVTEPEIALVHMAAPTARHRTDVPGQHGFVALQAARHHLQVGVPVAIRMSEFHRVFQHIGT